MNEMIFQAFYYENVCVARAFQHEIHIIES